ncbi:MAG: hypothetical protein A2017_21535 [Lentisphaerae bacterium GWF2_44_16]|nr:MAG: hypothetical protein A2017_21535 [Lentisphaerae bacterium GWF2_44_16]
MKIDIHTHITYLKFPEFRKYFKYEDFTAKTLLECMDEEGIDKSVILPISNPENVDIYGVTGNLETIEECRKHPDRFIPFCNIDPRSGLNTPKANLSDLMKIYKDLGCRGIGEICANIPITDKRYKNLFYHAALEKMPLLFHFSGKRFGTYGAYDHLHLPGLEECLKEFPETIFIGHSAAFWGEMAADFKYKERDGYPKTPVKKKGRLWELLDKYPNLYADLSAGSGWNAITRDIENGVAFLTRFQKKIMFGTDRFGSRKDGLGKKIISMYDTLLQDGKITKDVYDNITYKNFNRVIMGESK